MDLRRKSVPLQSVVKMRFHSHVFDAELAYVRGVKLAYKKFEKHVVNNPQDGTRTFSKRDLLRSELGRIRKIRC